MTDYNPPDDTEIAPSKAIKATTGRRLRDMSIAIAEGADGAPRVQGVALGGRYVAAQSATGGSWVTFTDLDNIKSFELFVEGTSTASQDRDVQLQTSADGGSTWGSSKDIGEVTQNSTNNFRFYVDLDSGDVWSVGAAGDGKSGYSQYSFGSDINAVRIRVENDNLTASLLIQEGFDPS